MSSVSYDFDTSPDKRRENPQFYGYIPDKASQRTIAFFSLFVATSTHMLSRVFSSALLLMVNWRYLVWFVGGEMGLYLLYRAATNDFVYWIPVKGVYSLIFSVTKRAFDKIIVDFTLFVHLRHPYELGGIWWCLCAAFSPIWCYTSAWVYFAAVAAASDETSDEASNEVSSGGESIDKFIVWSVLAFFTLVW